MQEQEDTLLVLDFSSQAFLWGELRKNSPRKLEKLPIVQKCLGSIEGNFSLSFEQPQIKADYYFCGGFGNFEHIKFTKGIYFTDYPVTEDYKNADTNEHYYEYFKTLGNDRYSQPDQVFVKQRPYNLFPLQMVYPKDYHQTLHALKWATESKRYTIFKTHPAHNGDQNYKAFWGVAKKIGVISEYTELVDNYRSEELVNKADMIFSADSALTLKAVLKNIPTFAMRNFQMNDIVPVIPKIPLDIKVPIVSKYKAIKWFDWFYRTVCNDITKNDFKDKIDRRLNLYKNGATDKELHSLTFLKNKGLA